MKISEAIERLLEIEQEYGCDLLLEFDAEARKWPCHLVQISNIDVQGESVILTCEDK